jgi:hypothetical protein
VATDSFLRRAIDEPGRRAPPVKPDPGCSEEARRDNVSGAIALEAGRKRMGHTGPFYASGKTEAVLVTTPARRRRDGYGILDEVTSHAAINS